MTLTEQIAKHIRDVHFGGNWTVSNLRDTLADVTWEQATARVGSLNTIVALVYHINYFVATMLKVLRGGPLDANDRYSFDHPPIASQQDWDALLNKVWDDARNVADVIGGLPESKLWETMVHEKYGNYYRNIHGIIEHSHYHLGQIVVIKRMLQQAEEQS